jgi:hypothetical protein
VLQGSTWFATSPGGRHNRRWDGLENRQDDHVRTAGGPIGKLKLTELEPRKKHGDDAILGEVSRLESVLFIAKDEQVSFPRSSARDAS